MVEAVAVPTEAWQKIVRKLDIHEQEDTSEDVRENVREAYAYIRSKVTTPPETLIGRKKLSIDPDYLGGTACFYESPRVPIRTLFDYIEENLDREEYLKDFPSISRSTVDYWLKIRR